MHGEIITFKFAVRYRAFHASSQSLRLYPSASTDLDVIDPNSSELGQVNDSSIFCNYRIERDIAFKVLSVHSYCHIEDVFP